MMERTRKILIDSNDVIAHFVRNTNISEDGSHYVEMFYILLNAMQTFIEGMLCKNPFITDKELHDLINKMMDVPVPTYPFETNSLEKAVTAALSNLHQLTER
jgi:hypothetical protein